MKNKCVMVCSGNPGIDSGYTRVRIPIRQYSQLRLITSVTGRTQQDTLETLLDFAVKHLEIVNSEGKPIDLGFGGDE